MRGGLCFGVSPGSGLWFWFSGFWFWFLVLVALRMRWRMGRLYGSNTSNGCSAVIFDRAIGVWCSYDLGMESINNTRYTIYDTPLLDYISTPQNSLEYPLNGTIGLNTIQSWWGNTVFTKTGDWNSVSLKTVAPGDTFGCVHFLTLFSFLFTLLYSTLLCTTTLAPYRNASVAKVSLTRDPTYGRPLSPLPCYPSWVPFVSKASFFPSTSGISPFWSITSLSPLFRVRYTTFRGMCSGTHAGHPSRASLLLETRTVTDAFVPLFSFHL